MALTGGGTTYRWMTGPGEWQARSGHGWMD